MFGGSGKKKENDLEDELFIFTRYKPGGLDSLCKGSHFNKKEIRLMYQGFKQECPSGFCTEEDFKLIFAKYFPQGDATKYAHLVFKTFKSLSCHQTGVLNFEQFLNMLSSLSRGSLLEKLRWIFALYDINGDGFISKQEMLVIVSAIYDMLGDYVIPYVDSVAPKDHVERLFHLIDADKDGVISFDEFTEWCKKDEDRAQALLMFDTIF
ncbi:Kv channel-interacting protein 4-like [Oppia nitens]|uniref:Kv channel-interacting protein 4-like n=1 Tax=Oppia nitens TaxID=1686743 RepID=UPI0023DC5D2F|nr:Kv channel-interacting protein 4-like [Oppia nitens]